MNVNLSAFLDAHFAHIYFLYGLAFFAMGLALALESRRTSQLGLARATGLLALFGLVHSVHEFREMFSILDARPLTVWEEVVQVGVLAGSFLPLLAFGLQLLPRAEHTPYFSARITILAAVAYVMQLMLVLVLYHPSMEEWIGAANALARYTLGIPGAALAALALMRQRRALLEMDFAPFGRDLALAAVALMWYGIVGQVFPKPSIIFPSMYVNAESFREWFGFPIQLMRGAMAIIVAVAIIRALRAFEEENRRRLEAGQETERELKIAARELSLLYEASHLLTATQDLDQLMQHAIERITQIIEPVKRAVIYVPDTEQSGSDHVASCGYREPPLDERDLMREIEEHSRLAQSSWLDPEGHDIADLVNASKPADEQPTGRSIRRVLLPLETSQRTLGTLLLETAPQGPYLSALEAPTISALARQLAIAIENAELVLRLRLREARRAELLQRATAAQEAERKRIARELHDETGQALTALSLGLAGISKLLKLDPDQATKQFVQLQEISSSALDELRHLISDLRPAHLDDLGLVAALRWYADQVMQRSMVKVVLRVSGEPYRLPPELETTLFRIAQEGLSNIVKHSGAQNATLALSFQQRCVKLRIQDDGYGFDPDRVFNPGAGRAWGLIGIQERVELAGGRFSIESEPGSGTVLIVSIPASAQSIAEERQSANGNH